MTQAIPVFRVFDYNKTIEFYVNWLGGQIQWEYKPNDGPFYMQVSIKDILINLSQHHGECSPGGLVLISGLEDLLSYHQALLDKNYRFMRPGLQKIEWENNKLVMRVIDPFYNTIEFRA